ncbi:hypothetical protein PQX77_019797 [Marasmius sp. AFHP31]|nr:hypothetical protein PQX77_019797 [Marasmius sp. AFHP31]
MASFELASRDNGTFIDLALQYFDRSIGWSQALPSRRFAITNALDDGYAAIRWYKAHGDNKFLQVARDLWDFAHHLTVSQETTSPNGTIATKGFPVPQDCEFVGVPGIEGATFRNASSADLLVGLYESSQFSLLSALLAEADPSNTTYARAASLSLDFAFGIASEFEYSVSNINAFSYLGGCGPLRLIRTGGTSNYGAMIEAMSILQSLTGNGDTGARLQQVINSTLYAIGRELGPGSNGVLFNGNDTQDIGGDRGDMYFLRGLAEAYKRAEGTLPADLKANMKVLLGVHYNAIRDTATTGDNVYSRNWRGPPSQTTFDLYNQAAAAQILVDGITLFNSSDDTSLPTKPSSSPETPSSPKPSTAVIAGAAAGSSISLLLIALAIFYTVRRWRRKSRTAPSTQFSPTTQVIAPFVATTSDNRNTLSQKFLLSEARAQVVPKAPLRRHNSAPSTFREAAGSDSTGKRDSTSNSLGAGSNARDHSSHPREYVHSGVDMDMAPSFPDMVRIVYQRLWAQNGLESPPDYRSDTAESRRV